MKNTQTITLETVNNQLSSSNVVIPSSVQAYLDVEKAKSYVPEGKFFRIVIDGKSVDNPGHGVSYYHQLKVEKFRPRKKVWEVVYESAMTQYRSGFASGSDNWDRALYSPTILAEDKKGVTFALQTGAGNVYVYQFKDKDEYLKTVNKFNIREYNTLLEKEQLVDTTTVDLESFISYIYKELGNGWHFPYELKTKDSQWRLFDGNADKFGWSAKSDELKEHTEFAVILAHHFDRDFDAVCDKYRVYFWVKGQGYGQSELIWTDLRHSSSRFYCYGVRIDDVTVKFGKTSITVTVKIEGTERYYERKHSFKVELKSPIPKRKLQAISESSGG